MPGQPGTVADVAGALEVPGSAGVLKGKVVKRCEWSK